MATRKREGTLREVPEESLFRQADKRADEIGDALAVLVTRLFRLASRSLSAERLAAAQSLGAPSLVALSADFNGMREDFRRILAPPPNDEAPKESKARGGNPFADLDPSGLLQEAVDAGIQLGVETLPTAEARTAGIDLIAARKLAYQSLNRDLIKQSLDALNESREALAMLVEHPSHLMGETGDSVRAALDGATLKQMFGIDKRQAAAIVRELEGLAKQKMSRTELRRYALRRYRAMVKQRIDVLAKTIAHEAVNKGQDAAWKQARIEGKLKTGLKEEWVARVLPCKRCLAFDGKRVDPGKPFISDLGEKSYGPQLHPRCRCKKRLVKPRTNAGQTERSRRLRRSA